jgi:hypothetical protein
MSLINCPACGAKVSSAADACPACGHPLKKAAKTYGCGALAAIGLAIFALVSLLSTCQSSSERNAAAAPASLPAQQPALPAYSLPTADSQSLVASLEVIRESDGSVTLRGVSLLPPKTQVWVERVSSSGQKLGQNKTVVGANGSFIAAGFSDLGQPIPPGPGAFEIRSHFNRFWQPDEVLDAVGIGGSKLPRAVITPDDPEFPDQGGHWVEKREIAFPEIAPETIAIERVKAARLDVQGQGRSPTAVNDVVAWYASNPGFAVRGWSAEKSGETWIVTLDCSDGGQPKQAKWEYDPATGAVRYLDPLSKILSWLSDD